MLIIHIMTPLQAKLDATDWNAYESRIIDLTKAGVEAYLAAAASIKIFQLSIWTDLDARVSAINFETASHAQLYCEEYANRLKDEKLYGKAAEVLAAGRSSNPANFLYRDAAECYHPELEPLRKLLGTRARFTQADAYLSERLKAVRSKILEIGILKNAPHEGRVWFGISSEESWYDHEVFTEL